MSSDSALTPTPCWSWKHSDGDVVPAESGTHTCREHSCEEPDILSVRSDLREVHRVLEKVRQLKAPGSDLHKAMVEGAVAEFLRKGLPSELRIGTGFYPADKLRSWHELDIVVDRGDAAGWYGDARLLDEGPPPFAHLEIAFRSTTGHSKASVDFGRLAKTVGRASEDGSVKVWTGSVLCGPGWATVRSLARRLVNSVPETVCPVTTRSGATWWPALDIAAAPGWALTKTDAALDPEGRTMLWMLMPGNPAEEFSQLRPLALAREKLINFCMQRLWGELGSRPLDRLPRPAVWGPRVGPELSPRIGSRRLIAVSPGQVQSKVCRWPDLDRGAFLERAPIKKARSWEWLSPSRRSLRKLTRQAEARG